MHVYFASDYDSELAMGLITNNKVHPEGCYHHFTNDPCFQPCGVCKICVGDLAGADNTGSSAVANRRKSAIHGRKRNTKRVRATK
jgi:hypothetical protein